MIAFGAEAPSVARGPEPASVEEEVGASVFSAIVVAYRKDLGDTVRGGSFYMEEGVPFRDLQGK